MSVGVGASAVNVALMAAASVAFSCAVAFRSDVGVSVGASAVIVAATAVACSLANWVAVAPRLGVVVDVAVGGKAEAVCVAAKAAWVLVAAACAVCVSCAARAIIAGVCAKAV